MTNQKKFLNGLIRWLPLVGLVLFFGLILWGYSRGIFHSVASLQAFIKQFGNYAVLCFILLQIVQVIIPILPGGISSVAGMLMFGNLQGLLYSYLGLIIGEFIGFLLVRYYGRSFVKIILSPNKYKKFEEILDKNEHNVKKLLIFTMLVPFAPDDIVCLVAGGYLQLLNVVFVSIIWQIITKRQQNQRWFCCLFFFRLNVIGQSVL